MFTSTKDRYNATIAAVHLYSSQIHVLDSLLNELLLLWLDVVLPHSRAVDEFLESSALLSACAYSTNLICSVTNVFSMTGATQVDGAKFLRRKLSLFAEV